MWRKIKKLIHEKSHFLITTHLNPDGDGIGSACAMIELLKSLGKKVRFVCEDPLPQKFAFLDVDEIFERYVPEGEFGEVEVMIILDANSLKRIGKVAELLDKYPIIPVCIDHHPTEELFTPYAAIDPTSCSVGALIYTLYKECGYDLTFPAAQAIYVSILYDTGRFSYSSTNRKAHKIADECIKKGVDPDEMYAKVFHHVSLNQIKLFSRALQRMETYFDNKVVVEEIHSEDYTLLEEEGASPNRVDLEYIHDFNQWIEDVKCIVLLRELDDGFVRISLRSKSDLDIRDVIKELGGGGHEKAAGAMVKGSLKEVKKKILKLLESKL